eukprot:SM000404S15666  [mRNA]  locus=s404:42949:45924:+ [translate_table: standard]
MTTIRSLRMQARLTKSEDRPELKRASDWACERRLGGEKGEDGRTYMAVTCAAASRFSLTTVSILYTNQERQEIITNSQRKLHLSWPCGFPMKMKMTTFSSHGGEKYFKKQVEVLEASQARAATKYGTLVVVNWSVSCASPPLPLLRFLIVMTTFSYHNEEQDFKKVTTSRREQVISCMNASSM